MSFDFLKRGAMLAPMAGVTDMPFRVLCHEMGCPMAVSEMVSAKGYVLSPRDNRAARELLAVAPQEEGAVALQLFGREPEIMARAAEELTATGRYALLAYGRMTLHAVRAAALLRDRGIEAGVIDCCSLKPMDEGCLSGLIAAGVGLITVEEGELIGGFGSEIARQCALRGAPEPVVMLGLENRFITHGSVSQLLEECGLTPEQIAARAEEAIRAWEETDER